MEFPKLAALSALPQALFPVGRVVCTRSLDIWAEEHLPRELYTGNRYIQILVDAHRCGIWGDIPPEDARTNRLSLTPGQEGQIMSSYTIGGQKIWVITEWDRSYTTLMLPDDY